MRTCEYCDKPAARRDLCWGHIKRRQRGADVSGDLRDYGEACFTKLLAASRRYYEAESDEEYQQAIWLMKYYALRYGKRSKRRPVEIVHAPSENIG